MAFPNQQRGYGTSASGRLAGKIGFIDMEAATEVLAIRAFNVQIKRVDGRNMDRIVPVTLFCYEDSAGTIHSGDTPLSTLNTGTLQDTRETGLVIEYLTSAAGVLNVDLDTSGPDSVWVGVKCGDQYAISDEIVISA